MSLQDRFPHSSFLAAPALALLLGCVVSLGCSPPDETASQGEPSADAVASGNVDLGPPNLLLITVDTLRADRLGSYGHSEAQTPHLDALAERGALLSDALTHVPMTLPSHASMMTGRLPFRTGVRNNGTYKLSPDELTLAEILDQAGYQTGAALGAFVLLEKFGLGQGFQTYDDSLESDHVLRVFDTEINADEVLAKWRTWLKSTKKDSRPFFYWAHFYDPHLPYAPPEPFKTDFASSPYDGEVAFVDQAVGHMLGDLEKNGKLDNTLVVVTSDHGEAFGEHGETGHGLTAYKPVLHVPLILAGPGIEGPQVVSSRVGLVDLMPTLLEILDIPLPSEPPIDGRSFLGLMRGETEDSQRTVYFETLLGQEDRNWAPLTGLYSDNRKLISVPRPELYDVEADPDEARNLVSAERRTFHALDQDLQQLLLSTSSDSERRELTPEDQAKLESLGYISGQGKGRGSVLDPKDGLKLDQGLREIEASLLGDPEKARRDLADLKASFPDQILPSFFMFEHRIAVRQNRVDDAIAALEQGIQALPDIYPLRYELARYLIDRGRFDHAARVCEELVERYPDLSQGWILLGRCYETQDLEKAFEVYVKGLSLEPGNHKLASRMADIRAQLGDFAGALQRHDTLFSTGYYDDKPELLFKTAMLHMRHGSTEIAESLFATALGLEPQGFYYMSYALVLERNGRRDEAKIALENALSPSMVDDLSADQAQLARSTLDRWQSRP